MNTKTNTKENILNAWLAVERLSEGNFDEKGAKSLNIDDDKITEFDLLEESLRNLKVGKDDKPGIILYGGIIPSSEITNILREKYKLKPTNEDIASVGNKFSFALVFDSEFNLDQEKTFITVSAYIKQCGKIPTEDEFAKFEQKQKEKLHVWFDFDQKYKDGVRNLFTDGEDYTQLFCAYIYIKKIKELFGEDIYVRAVKNIDTDTANMHSFFVQDLEIAKKLNTPNLDKYISGQQPTRVDLNTRKESAHFNPEAIEKILQPDNYPLSRFPSNPNFAPTLMQQIAINLATGADRNSMRSVNGPPGTGKTTLLKDIFAELVTKQALAITQLSDKRMQDDDGTTYYGKGKIGILAKEIADNGILVASSNNGAVQNIVSELPQIDKIDPMFRDELLAVDYFTDILNHPGKYQESGEQEKSLAWGLFSLEGGAKKKLSNLIWTLKKVYDYLNSSEYMPDFDAYEDFKKLYAKVYNYRAQIGNYAEQRRRLLILEPEAKELNDTQAKLIAEIKTIREKKRRANEKIEALKLQRPQFYIELLSGLIRSWKNYRKQMTEFSNELISLLKEEDNVEGKLSEISEKQEKIQKEISDIRAAIKPYESAPDIKPLDLSADYDDLQKSTPWFGREYRIMQSRLFISAMRVRKLFLYENRNHIRAAHLTWRHLEAGEATERAKAEAWNWMNFVVPVIGTTFASVRNMLAAVKAESVGHLFIDEAGQALPWASIGAIYRSRHVMAVGDPSQILPILSVDSNILKLIRELYSVNGKYLSAESSTQTFLDDVSKYGFYKDDAREEWIGIPLWVHRRCAYPMFDISNAISYDGNMTQGNPKKGFAEWWDVQGTANNKYVKEQGEKVKQYLSEHRAEYDKVYVITPFKNVAYVLSKELSEIGFTQYEQMKPVNVGTVHTFQGKENDTVILVLGADEKSKGAANWAMGEQNPNIMNVAATRAKNKLIIVGDKKLYLSLNSSVINKTCSIIDKFNKANTN